MHSDNKSTKVSQSLQESLAAYGIVRSEVEQKAPTKKNGKPNFFGVKESSSDTELLFDSSIEAIQDKGMTVAIAAPELDSFDMLVTTNFEEAVKTSTPETLRDYLRRIVDRA